MVLPRRDGRVGIRLSAVASLCGLWALAWCAGAAAAEEKETPPSGGTGTSEQVLAEMKKELGPGFQYRKVRCFVAASDASAEQFARVCDHTLGECTDAYEKQFFKAKPTGSYRAYLFKDDASYRQHAKKLFGDVPDTPFGYYTDSHRALVMNIGTGGGTLVHEMFHALVRPDFPDIPAWTNEGIASLFEQCQITEQGLMGLVNWRLPILQSAIRTNDLPALRKIMTMTDAEFYQSRGGHYAAARYFMLYLQEKGVLVEFYRRFRDRFKEDKTGVKFAEEVLTRKLEEFEPDWRKWVMGLKR